MIICATPSAQLAAFWQRSTGEGAVCGLLPSISVRPPFDCFCQAVPFGPALKLGSWRNWDVFDLGASRGLVARVVGFVPTALLGQSWWRRVGAGAVLVGAATTSTTAAFAGMAGMLMPSKSAAGNAANPRLFKGPSLRKIYGSSGSSGNPHPTLPRERGRENRTLRGGGKLWWEGGPVSLS